MKQLFIYLLLILLLVLLSNCANVTDVDQCIPVGEHIYGFWGGVWHGMICQFSFIGSLFSDKIAVYAVNNNGGWYNFGFVGGLGIIIRLIAFVFKLIKNS